ncbi:helix-turn-helix domain-containing protein [Enterovirga rhinocerotis]|uniref:AraC-like DNA-binding protein n=1 Tax=Enterovirga rhinocerotis TaxID=1339210 RepID=A0A4R7BRI5_9HYPH|nr:AraC family transcriptional regulator [Enterovirga rhinocerotis]TDR87065.1 AraC-like DNA-binding protein [Enterovirga rhinocerotis]
MASAPTITPDSREGLAPIPFSFLTSSAAYRSGEYTVAPILDDQEPVLAGRFRHLSLRDGLVLHVTETEDLHDLHTSALQRPGLGFYLFLEDTDGLDVSIGGRTLPIGRHRRPDAAPLGLLMSWQRPARFVRRARRGTRVHKAMVSVSPDWLDQTFGRGSPVLPVGASEHLAISRWFPSHRLCALVGDLLKTDPRGTPPVARLRDESIALDLIGEALATLEPPSAGNRLARTDAMRLGRARDVIEAALSEDLSVAAIGDRLGLGAGSLQRLFRSGYGCSVYEYVRGRRLDAARARLEQGETVASAAKLAGYGSAANFATAFRRRFGLTPRQARAGNGPANLDGESARPAAPS